MLWKFGMICMLVSLGVLGVVGILVLRDKMSGKILVWKEVDLGVVVGSFCFVSSGELWKSC